MKLPLVTWYYYPKMAHHCWFAIRANLRGSYFKGRVQRSVFFRFGWRGLTLQLNSPPVWKYLSKHLFKEPRKPALLSQL